jgi:Fe-S oxidoreductase/nitrate reductase gamma subunit
LFYALAAVSVVLFVVGCTRRVRVWMRGGGSWPRPDLRRLLLDGLLGRRIFAGDLASGAMHLLLAVGFAGLFAGTLLAALDHYLVPFLRGAAYLVFSLAVDVSGVLFMAGLLWALARRYLQRVPRLERGASDLAVLLWLVATASTGFLVEALRLAVQRPPWAGWSFGGLGVSLAWPEAGGAAAAYPVAWWTHALLSLGLVAAIPFTRLFHIVTAPAAASVADESGTLARAAVGTAFPSALRLSLDACTRCGRCVEVCPSTLTGEPFAPRDLVAAARQRLSSTPSGAGGAAENGELADATWYCTTCGACLRACPLSISTPWVAAEVRRQVVEEGTRLPTLVGQTLEKLSKYDNPWEGSKKKRASWARGLDLVDLTRPRDEEPRICYFVGCTTAYDTRAQRIARSLVEIFSRTGVSIGTLGKREPCCGDAALRLGEAGLFEEQREGCLRLLERSSVSRVVTSSPHCMHAMRNEYAATSPEPPATGHAALDVRHYVELLDELRGAGSLRLTRPVDARVTFHDPCYLGRYNGVFEAPRRLLRAVPGVEVVEMGHHGVDSTCCGGGGGRMWQGDSDGAGKISEMRIREAVSTGADILVTACPLCLVMLEDARKTAAVEDRIQVSDLGELVARALGPAGAEGVGTGRAGPDG